LTGNVTFQDDNEGITFNGGGRFYKQSGQGLVIRKPSGGQELRFEDNSGTFIGTFWHSGNDGSGSGLDADTVDGIQGSSFLRSDANDTKSGNLVLRTDGAVTDSTTGLLFEVGGSYTDGRYRTRFRKQDVGGGIPLYIDQSGSTANSYTAQARFGTYSGNNYEFEVYGDINATGNIYDGGNAVWHAGNDGSGSSLDADLLDGYNTSTSATANTVVVREGSGHIYGNYILGSYFNASSGNNENPTIGQVWTQSTGDNYLRKSTPAHFKSQLGLWHTGNDGSGSGLDADTVDGLHVNSTTTNNQANKIVRTNASGYTDFGWIWTVSGTATGSLSRIYCSQDGYIRYLAPSDLGTSWLRENVYNNLIDSTGSGANLNTVFNNNRSGNIDCWSGTNFPSGTSHVQGIQVRHSTSSHYGFQLVNQYNQDKIWHRRITNNSFGGWQQVWTANSDGAGSGLDADTVDGIQGSTLQGGSLGTDYYVNALYHDDWVRNHYNSNGHYWSTTGWHIYPKDADDFFIRAGSGSCGLAMTVGNETARGYVYANTSNEIGFLNSARSWSFKVDNSGNATATGNVTAYSDRRLKSDIEPLTNSLNTVCQLQGVKYKRNSTGATEIGFVAQDVKKVVPELVDIIDGRTENSDGVSDGIEDLHVMKYQNTVALLVESIKELKAEVDDLKTQLEKK
jgi:hypothetical protein